MEKEEKIIMQLIMHGGDARAYSMRAIQSAEKGDFIAARDSLEQAILSLNKAHDLQSTIIQEETRGEANGMTLLMAHAQDHVMNAMTVIDLAEHMIHLSEEIHLLKTQTLV